MAATDLLVLAVGLLAYPLAVLAVALTGPHSEFERRELADYKRWKAGKATEEEVRNTPLPYETEDWAAILSARKDG